MKSGFQHETVLLKEMIDMLDPGLDSFVVDCTLGGGGHTQGLMERVGAKGSVLALDRDMAAITHAQEIFADEIKAGRLVLEHSDFSTIAAAVQNHAAGRPVKAICADLGVSSVQLDQADRGFSFRNDGPLDMRMNPEGSDMPASEIVNSYPEKQLAQILREYGEEPRAFSIAAAIVRRRSEKPFFTTLDLAQVVEKAARYSSPSKKHPATKTFQALRIEVNAEMAELKTLLKEGFSVLSPGGRFGVITFHSLEDRMVKHFMADRFSRNKAAKLPREAPLKAEEIAKMAPGECVAIEPFPCDPDDAEIERNSRARSAKLRVIQKN